MTDQQTAPHPGEERTHPDLDRRRGPRRAGAIGEVEDQSERRQNDRRKKKPGFAGLWGAIFGHSRSEEKTGS
jgi:hypothetical protein